MASGRENGETEKESETKIAGYWALSSHKMQKQMRQQRRVCEATKCPQTQIQPSPNVSLIFKIRTALPHGQPQWAERYPRPPGSLSKELAKTISLKSPAILIWQPDSITRRKNCFSCHQQWLENYLNCVMIMPQSSGASFKLLLPFRYTGGLHECCQIAPLSAFKRREDEWEIHSSLRCSDSVQVVHKQVDV